MGDNNENDAQGSVIHLPASLWNIPYLPFEIICSSLDTSTLMNLCLVCKKFNSYIKNEIPLQEWKKRAKNIWSDAVYPILSPANSDKLFWRKSCAALQKQKALCTQNDPLVTIDSKDIHMIDAGCLLSSLLLICRHDDIAYIAAKGRHLFYKKINSEHSDIYLEAHREPIEDLTILSNKIYSCSTDNESIKSWELNGHLQMETSYNFVSGPVKDYPNCLSSNSGQYNFAVGSYYGYVTVFDSRLRKHVDQYPLPEEDRYMITTLAMNSEYILSATYGKKVFVYDRRNKKIIKNPKILKGVRCIKMQQDCVLIGDGVGKLHVLNPRNNFKVENSYDIGHTCGTKGVHLTYGNLITSSTSEVIISSPTDPPRHMYTLNVPNIIRMDYQKNTLALANTSDQILIYQFIQ